MLPPYDHYMKCLVILVSTVHGEGVQLIWDKEAKEYVALDETSRVLFKVPDQLPRNREEFLTLLCRIYTAGWEQYLADIFPTIPPIKE